MSTATYDALGFAGGIIISIGLLPQILKTIYTRSAVDISYFWQGTYALGIAITLVYAYGEALYPLAIPLTVELLFIFILIVLKIIFDQHMFEKVSAVRLEEDLQMGSDQVASRPESPLTREASEVAETGHDIVTDSTLGASQGTASENDLVASPFVTQSGATRRLLQALPSRKSSPLFPDKTWHAGTVVQPVESSVLRRSTSISVYNETSSYRDLNKTWHGGNRLHQRLPSLLTNMASVDEEAREGSLDSVVVRLIDTQSRLQMWL